MATGNVTDNQTGNTYALDAQLGPIGGGQTATASIYSCIELGATSGTFTITVNPAGAGDYFEWIGVEFSGLVDSSGLDKAAANTGTNTLPTVTGLTTTQADELWIGVVGVTDNNAADISIDNPAGWIQISYVGNAAATIGFLASYKIVSVTATLTYDGGTLARTPVGGWAAAVTSYKGAAAAGGSIVPIVDWQYRQRRQ